MLVSLGLIGLSFWDFGLRGRYITPPFWIPQKQGERWDQTEIWVPRAVVIETSKDGFLIENHLQDRIWIRPPHPEAVPGRQITLSGVFHIEEEGWLELRTLRSLRGPRWGRHAVALLSFGVLAFLFWRFSRAFRTLPLRPLLFHVRRG